MKNEPQLTKNKSPLTQGYLIRNPYARKVIQGIDFFLKWALSGETAPRLPKNPKSILVCNLANLGDVVIATAVLPALKTRFPEVQIGFLVGSWADPIVRNHPLVNHVYHLDHWYLSPTKKSRLQKVFTYLKMRRKALNEIRSKNYEVAIDLYCFFPNAIPLIAEAKIPIRVGYESGGFGPLLSHSFPWKSEKEYMGVSNLKLLKTFGLDPYSFSPLPSYIEKQNSIRDHIPKKYMVFHIGSSSPLKDWSIENWKSVVQKISNRAIPIVFTGKGEREASLVAQVFPESKNGINLCDRLSWSEFASVIQGAHLLLSADSVSVHLAAAAKVPTLILFSGINSMEMWLPPYPLCQGLMNQVACSPCFAKEGCSSMSCMGGLLPEIVLHKLEELLSINDSN
jgi:ADP-heptose:LPS heptosyltransferase